MLTRIVLAEGGLKAEMMAGKRNSMGEIMLARESATSPGITCKKGAGKVKYKVMIGTETLEEVVRVKMAFSGYTDQQIFRDEQITKRKQQKFNIRM